MKHEYGAPESDLVGQGMLRWRKERPDIDCSGKAVVGRIIRLQDLAIKAINQRLENMGLKFQEYAVLATLRVAGAPYQLSPSKLQNTLLVSSGGLSNLLKRMESDGLIARSTDLEDKRGVQVRLTDEGVALADLAMPLQAQTEHDLLTMLTPSQQKQLSELLSIMLLGNSPE